MEYNFSILIILISLLIILLYSKKNVENFSNIKFSDKLKEYGKNLPENYSFYADKYLVKKYINEQNIPNLICPKTLMTLDKNEDLNLNKLPRDCVIKTNNGSGDVIVIKDRKIKVMTSRIGGFKKKLSEYKKWKEASLAPYKKKYEKHYLKIKPKIFIEEYLGDNIKDYKFFCLDGKILFLQIDGNRFQGHFRNLYDENFNLLDVNHIEGIKKNKKLKNSSYNLKKPKFFYEMKLIAKQLSKPFKFVRVDLYFVNNKIYFGELTFVPAAGFQTYTNEEYDYKLGSLWK